MGAEEQASREERGGARTRVQRTRYCGERGACEGGRAAVRERWGAKGDQARM